jgi:hypothetical protein
MPQVEFVNAKYRRVIHASTTGMQRCKGCEPVPEKALLLMQSILKQFDAPVTHLVDLVHFMQSPN